MSQQKTRILFVDDDVRLLEGVRRNLHDKLDVVTATSAIEGLRALDQDGPFPILITDQNMPRVDGISFLEKAVAHFPETICIMLSGNPDHSTLVRAVNNTRLFRFLTKPCGTEQLLEAVEAAGQEHERRCNEQVMLARTISGSVNLLSDLAESRIPAIAGRAELVRLWARAAVNLLDLKHGDELEKAARLWPLSYVVMSPRLSQKRLSGEEISDKDQAEIAAAYMSAAKLLNNVPSLSGAARILLMTGAGASLPEKIIEAELLRILIRIGLEVDPAKPEQAEQIAAKLLTGGEYHPAVAAALPGILSAGGGSAAKNNIVTLGAFELAAGDLLLSDLQDDDGRLLLASGQTVSTAMLERIRELHAHGKVSARLRVVRASARAA